MRVFQVLSLVLGVYGGRLMAEICPPDWHRYGESCYFIITRKMVKIVGSKSSGGVVHGTITTAKTLTLPYASSLLAVVAASLLSACFTTPWRSSWVKASDHAGRLAVHIPDVTPSICLNKLEGRWFVHEAARVIRKRWRHEGELWRIQKRIVIY